MWLGLDPSLNGTGLVVYDEESDVIIYNKTIKFDGPKAKRHPKVQHFKTAEKIPFLLKINIITEELSKVMNTYKITKIVYERSFGAQKKSITYVGMVTGIAFGLAFTNGSTLHEKHANTIKKAVTGNGSASKDEVAKGVKEKFKGIKFNSDDETDAAGAIIAALKEEKE